MDWTVVVAALITALLGSGGVAAFFEYRIKKTADELKATTTRAAAEVKEIADRRQDNIDEWGKLIGAQGKRIEKLEQAVCNRDVKIESQACRIDELELELDELRTWITDKGLTPPPRRTRSRKV